MITGVEGKSVHKFKGKPLTGRAGGPTLSLATRKEQMMMKKKAGDTDERKELNGCGIFHWLLNTTVWSRTEWM